MNAGMSPGGADVPANAAAADSHGSAGGRSAPSWCDDGGHVSADVAAPVRPEALLGRAVHSAPCAAGGVAESPRHTGAAAGQSFPWRLASSRADDAEELTWQQLQQPRLEAPPGHTALSPAFADSVVTPAAAAAAPAPDAADTPPSATPPCLPPSADAAGEAEEEAPAAGAAGAEAAKAPAEAAAKRAPRAVAAPAAAPGGSRPSQRFKGVYRNCDGKGFRASLWSSGRSVSRGPFSDAVTAAREYDAMARAAGVTALNFPRAAAGEVQAVPGLTVAQTLRLASAAPAKSKAKAKAQPQAAAGKGGSGVPPAGVPPAPAVAKSLLERRVRKTFPGHGTFEGCVVSTRAAGALGRLWHVSYDDGDSEDLNWSQLSRVLLPPPKAPKAPKPAAAAAAARGGSARFKGVYQLGDVFRADLHCGGRRYRIGVYPDAVTAARAFDAMARRMGIRVVNFPRPGTAEVRAERGVRSDTTLARHQPGGNGGGGDAVPPGFVGGDGARRMRKRKAADSEEEEEEESADDEMKGPPGFLLLPAPRPTQLPRKRGAPAQQRDADAAAAPAAPAIKQAKQPQAAGVPAPHADVAPPAPSPHADVAAFLRAVTPPLSCLSDSLAALPRSGITMAHLAHAAAAQREFRQMALQTAAEALRIRLPGDRMALEMALQSLAPQQRG